MVKNLAEWTRRSLGLGLLLLLVGCGGDSEPVDDGGGPVVPAPTVAFQQLWPAGQRRSTYVGSERCLSCHSGQINATTWSQTRHAEVSVGCEQCHGPGSAHAETPSMDTILTYPHITRPVVCGQCHIPIAGEYQNSPHAKVVEELVDPNFVGRNPSLYVGTCYRCHSAPFRVEQVDSQLAVGKTPDQIDVAIGRLGNAELTTYVAASHETASCVTVCHDPHRNTGNLTAEGDEVQLRRAISNLDTTDIGPGTPVKQHTTFNQICAACHNGRGTNPSDAALEADPSRPNMHESNQYNMLMGIGGVEGSGPVVRNTAHADSPGQCTHCHMAEGRHNFVADYNKGCTGCHSASDIEARSAIKGAMELSLFILRTRMERWARQELGDPAFWDYTALVAEQGKTAPPQHQVPIQIKRARHNYYFVLRDGSFGIHNAPYARHLLNIANQELTDLGVTRMAPDQALIRGSRQQIRAVLEGDLQRLRVVEVASQ